MLKVSTNGYGGKRVTKKIKVKTNDKKRPLIQLTISGQVSAQTPEKPKG